MNVVANADAEVVTVLVDTGDVTVLATADRDATTGALLEALSVADEQLQCAVAKPHEDARDVVQPLIASDGGRP